MLFARGRVAERSLYFCQNVWYTKGVTIKRYIFERGINMPKSLGKTIRRLRIERGYTQEDLARLLSVSPQTVSKWENETNMPDISLIVPLANVLSVTTDSLFGLEPSADEAVRNACSRADALWKSGDYMGTYKYLREELKLRPNCTPLLLMCLEYGSSLAYSYRGSDYYDPVRAPEIYRECVRMADVIFEHSKDVTEILRSHMIMVFLHSSHGRFEDAEEHAKQFPWRADMTFFSMKAYIAHLRNDPAAVAKHLQADFLYKFESVLDVAAPLASALFDLGKYADALTVTEFSLGFIKGIFKGAPVLPRLWERDLGNLYVIAVKSLLALGDNSAALERLEELVRRESDIESLTADQKFDTPLLGAGVKNYNSRDLLYMRPQKAELKDVLCDACFDAIRSDPRFADILTSLG